MLMEQTQRLAILKQTTPR